MKRFRCVTLVLLCALILPAFGQTITLGSKAFTESNVLSLIAKQKLEAAGFQVTHKADLGGTGIVWAALKSGSITAYPDYTGTITEEILKSKKPLTLEEMREQLKPLGIGVTGELGFNDGYGLAMRQENAQKLGINTISDLQKHPQLRVGITQEFLKRQDGWSPLSARYNLRFAEVRGIEHSLAYEALKSDQIDLTDVYTTDAKIGIDNLEVLQDDKAYFPLYKAVFLYRLDLPPAALEALKTMEGTIDEAKMIQMNIEAEKTKSSAKGAALYFVGQAGQNNSNAPLPAPESLSANLSRWIGQHLLLVGVSMFFAIVIGVPLGVIAGKPGILSQLILGAAGMIQTVPSLALLVLLIPFLGLGATTAILALFLYSLLPIVRSTATGLQDIPVGLRESAQAMGLSPRSQLFKVFLPMASRSILSGIKTSAVISVGTATLAGLIGAGGLGEPIISGLRLNDANTILQGAIPAAVLALLVQFGFDLLDRVLIPAGLRLKPLGDNP